MSGRVKRVPAKTEGIQLEKAKALEQAVDACFMVGFDIHEVVAIVWNRMIQKALQSMYGNQSAACRRLKLSRNSMLWYLKQVKEHGKT